MNRDVVVFIFDPLELYDQAVADDPIRQLGREIWKTLAPSTYYCSFESNEKADCDILTITSGAGAAEPSGATGCHGMGAEDEQGCFVGSGQFAADVIGDVDLVVARNVGDLFQAAAFFRVVELQQVATLKPI